MPSYRLYSDIGGFVYWAVVKLCRTKLKTELEPEHDSRNVFFFIIFTILVGFISVRILKIR
jgi:hypothetical protein